MENRGLHSQSTRLSCRDIQRQLLPHQSALTLHLMEMPATSRRLNQRPPRSSPRSDLARKGLGWLVVVVPGMGDRIARSDTIAFPYWKDPEAARDASHDIRPPTRNARAFGNKGRAHSRSGRVGSDQYRWRQPP